MWGVEVRSGYALEVLLRGDRVVGLRIHGTEIEEFHQPRLMSAGEQANLLDRFWTSADRLTERGASPGVSIAPKSALVSARRDQTDDRAFDQRHGGTSASQLDDPGPIDDPS
jgi:hypothetical protein